MIFKVLVLTVLALTTVAVLFIMAPLRLRVNYQRQDKQDHLVLTLGPFWGLLPFKITVPFLDLVLQPGRRKLEYQAKAGEREGVSDETAHKKVKIPSIRRIYILLKHWWPLVRAVRPGLRYLKYRVRLRQLNWRTELGFDDAAKTGQAVGAAWALKGILLNTVYMTLPPGQVPPRVQVQPSFNCVKMRHDFDCVIELRPVHLLISGMITAYRYLPGLLRRKRASKHRSLT